MGNKALLILVLSLATACSNPLTDLIGGPQVNTNAQVGATNSQTIGQTSVSNTRLVRPQAETISTGDTSSKINATEIRDVTVNETDYWLLLLALIGWLLPSPGEMARSIRKMFTKEKGPVRGL